MCAYVEPSDAVMPGWACHHCHGYNGLHRKKCKHCLREPCPDLKIPHEDLIECAHCGAAVPKPAHEYQGRPLGKDGKVLGGDNLCPNRACRAPGFGVRILLH